MCRNVSASKSFALPIPTAATCQIVKMKIKSDPFNCSPITSCFDCWDFHIFRMEARSFNTKLHKLHVFAESLKTLCDHQWWHIQHLHPRPVSLLSPSCILWHFPIQTSVSFLIQNIRSTEKQCELVQVGKQKILILYLMMSLKGRAYLALALTQSLQWGKVLLPSAGSSCSADFSLLTKDFLHSLPKRDSVLATAGITL